MTNGWRRSTRTLVSLVMAITMVSTTSASADTVAPLMPGDILPPLEGHYLTGRPASLPSAASGRSALILVGFTYASRVPVEAWGEWFRKAVGIGPDRTFFEVPMIGGLGKMGRWFIDRGMRSGTPTSLHENVITVYSKTGDWKRRLGATPDNDKHAFLILIDGTGLVQWRHVGPFDQSTADELFHVVMNDR